MLHVALLLHSCCSLTLVYDVFSPRFSEEELALEERFKNTSLIQNLLMSESFFLANIPKKISLSATM